MNSVGATDRFRSIEDPAKASLMVLGSKFIAHLAPAANAAEAEAVMSQRQRRYPDATHHCWAYRVGRPGALEERSSDAGEPNGTAGRPIADALMGAGLENVVCVVTRYFGGTKLGTGGLVRAYGDATRDAIAAAVIVERVIERRLNVTFAHERTGVVYRVLDEFGLHLEPGEYDSEAHGTVWAPESRVDQLTKRLGELAHEGVTIAPGELRVR